MYDTISNYTGEARTTTTTAAAATTTELMRYVWHWIALGLMVLAG